MACELCGITLCYTFGVAAFPYLDQSGPDVSICAGCITAKDLDLRLIRARAPSLVGPPAPAGCESCGGNFSVLNKVKVISNGTHYDVCGICSWLSPAQLAANIQARTAAGLNQPLSPAPLGPNKKPGYMTISFQPVLNPNVDNIWGLPEPAKPTKTVAENGLEGMYCKSCNTFNSWVEPNSGSEYVCPCCR